MSYTIIDRRSNPKGKNLSNRQRFLNRTKQWVKEQVKQRSGKRDITSNKDESISVSGDSIAEPSFDYNRKVGDWDRVLPGNKDFVVGDKIKRNSGGSGQGNKAGDGADGEDSFTFSISKDEYLDILFEDLELPDLVKESEKAAIAWERKRAGFSTAGTPNNLDLERSLKNALGRRIALAFPLDRKIREKEELLAQAQTEEERAALIEEIRQLKTRRSAVAYIDQVDVRYKRHTKVPLPNSQAVVFCLMDVSGSMGEPEKETAKRFFLLLYLFLQRKYKKVDIVFVRHTTEANECSEEEFFYGKQTGGTIVSSGVKEVNKILGQRYPLDNWNVYCVQASDGDNFNSDEDELARELEKLVPKCQYYVYNEVLQSNVYRSNTYTTSVYDTMTSLTETHSNLAVVQTASVNDVVPAFRKVFTKKDK